MMHIDLSGKRALVTGGNGGIGYEMAKGLGKLGAEVVITGRDPEKLKKALEFLKKDSGVDRFAGIQADFAELSQVERVAQEAGDLDLLINNAGLITKEQSITADGHELQWQVNTLAPLLLSWRLKSNFTADGHIINIVSGAHKRGKIDADDLNFNVRPYSAMAAYSQSKLALVMITRHLAQMWAPEGPRVNAVHPGVVRTDIAREGSLWSSVFHLLSPFFQSPRRGARTGLYLACVPDLADANGGYFYRNMERQPSPTACDDAACKRVFTSAAQQLRLNVTQ